MFAGVRRAEDGDRLQTRYAGDLRPVMLDVSDHDQVRRVIDDIERDTGSQGLAGLVNNAGVGVGGPAEYASDDDWRWVFDVNLFGVVALTQAALPLLRSARGRIVHVGSIGGRIATPGLAPYAASKHALEALAEAQRHELARSGAPVLVSLVEPGEVKTAIWEKGDAQVVEVERTLDGVGHERYGWLLDQTRGFLDEGRRRGIRPERVAKAIERALVAKRPKARYLVGPDAKVYGHIVARSPDRARDALVRIGSRRWERRGRKLRRAARASHKTAPRRR